jgi:hypothetical protein
MRGAVHDCQFVLIDPLIEAIVAQFAGSARLRRRTGRVAIAGV